MTHFKIPQSSAKGQPVFYSLGVIMLLNFTLSYLSAQEGHDWGGDFALYLDQAKALFNGSLDHLFVTNKYAMDNSALLLGPYLYPNGFPVLLAPILSIFGLNFVVLKVFCLLFLVGSLPLIFHLFKNEFPENYTAYFITIFIAFHSSLFTFSDYIMADLPAFFLSALAIFLMTRKVSFLSQVCLGLVIFYTWFTRDIGICLIPTLMVYQLFCRDKDSGNKLLLLLPYLVIAVLVGISKSIFHQDGVENHYDILLGMSVESLVGNISYNFGLLSETFTLSTRLSWITTLIVLPVISVGMIINWKKNLYMTTYVVSILFILTIWPAPAGIRYFFPIMPFLVFFFLKGAIFIFNKYGLQKRINTAFLVYLVMFASLNLVLFFRTTKVTSNQAYTKEMKEIYTYLSANIDSDEVIGFHKPRVLRFFTGINSIQTDALLFENSVAKYLLVSKAEMTSTYPLEASLLANKYNLEAEFTDYYLFVK